MKELRYTPPVLRAMLVQHGYCGTGSSATADQGLCQNGVDTGSVPSGSCDTGSGVADANICGSGTDNASAGGTALCYSGSGVKDSPDTGCYTGSTATTGMSGTNCSTGNAPG